MNCIRVYSEELFDKVEGHYDKVTRVRYWYAGITFWDSLSRFTENKFYPFLRHNYMVCLRLQLTHL